jgi:hypothetical protein
VFLPQHAWDGATLGAQALIGSPMHAARFLRRGFEVAGSAESHLQLLQSAHGASHWKLPLARVNQSVAVPTGEKFADPVKPRSAAAAKIPVDSHPATEPRPAVAEVTFGPCDRPKIDATLERKAQRQLKKGIGILKVAVALGLGTGTVQRIKQEMSAA